MKDGERRQQAGTFEEAKAALESSPAPETKWDKEAPTGPPTPARRAYPEWLEPLVKTFKGIVADEGLLADLCLEKAIDIVQFNHDRGLAGIDYFPEANPGAMPANRTSIVAMSVPFAVEFYKQCVQACNSRADELKVAYNEAMAIRAIEEKKRIVVSGT